MKPPCRLQKVIGRGGFAEVWRAVSREKPDEMVALKRPHATETASRRMRREIVMQRRYAGPHVMPAVGSRWFGLG